jgi:hypothetical protein
MQAISMNDTFLRVFFEAHGRDGDDRPQSCGPIYILCGRTSLLPAATSRVYDLCE